MTHEQIAVKMHFGINLKNLKNLINIPDFEE